MKSIATITVMAIAPCIPALAQNATEQELAKDVVLRALVDELDRGTAGLTLADLERPYFIEYALSDSVRDSVRAQWGALTGKNTYRNRRLRCEVRVGSYTLDNTNFSAGFSFDFGGMGDYFGAGGSIPIEDDYGAIRQGIWWATDRKYKSVIEALAKKKAFMESKVIEDKPDDFSKETPVVHFEPGASLQSDIPRLEQIAITLSNLFKSYPAIKTSSVSLNREAQNNYLVNSEGTRLRTVENNCSLTASVTVQAEDGMELGDSLTLHGKSWNDLPPPEELARRCRTMVEQLIALKDAPKLETYTGPVLFEPRAAAAIFASNFGSRFAGGQRPLGSRTMPDDFANKLGKRVLPRFLSVMDDPTIDKVAGVPVLGHYLYDDQGVAARAVSLIENGKLKALVMSRNPSKEFAHSTGHGRGAYGPRAAAANIVVTANPASDAAGLKEDLLEACQDEDLPFGMRVASMGKPSLPSRFEGMDFSGFDFDMGSFSGGRGGGETPLVMYKVFPDGHEELVRGAEIARIDMKAFKRILAAGDQPFVWNKGGGSAQTFCVPALLFEELDLAKIDRDFDKPPIIPSPLASTR